jgi:hypothetical protein
MKIVKYSEVYSRDWDEFVKVAKNGHFLFSRKYMDYHSDRFTDHSLLVFDDKDRLLAILPANISGDTLYSHQGLTFGGFVISLKVKTEIMLNIFSLLIDYLKSIQIEKLIYKPIPPIYTEVSAQEELYALFISDARLFRRDVSSAIDLSIPFKYSKGRKWTVNKAKKENIELCRVTEYTEFWKLLSNVLASQHGATPVHSLSEIEYLQNCFPENIKLFVAKKNGEVIAGAVIYETELVAHTQYLANSDEGREIGALDLLVDHLIKDVYKDKKYFDFGISTEDEGRSLNKGLIAQKEGFGASAVVHDFYELDIK